MNLAVSGRDWQGAGQGIDNLAYIALGTGIGGGLVVGGELVRGRGQCGGRARLPAVRRRPLRGGVAAAPAPSSGWSPRPAIRARYAALTGEDVGGAGDLRAGRAGRRGGRAVLDETARLLARGIAAIAAIANPRHVILGGSIGVRPELIARVRALLPLCIPAPVAVEPSRLGPQAALIGAAAIGLGQLHNTLFGADAPEAGCRCRRRGVPLGGDCVTGDVSTTAWRRRSTATTRWHCSAAPSAARASPATRRTSSPSSPTRCGGAASSGVTGGLPARPAERLGRAQGRGRRARACCSSATPTPCTWTAGASIGRAPSARTRSPRRSSTARSGVAARAISRPASPPASRRWALLDRAGVRLTGDVAFAFVGDEESGQPGTGVSAGVKHFVGRIEAGEVARPDFAVYVEPTRLAVYPAQIGFFIAEITVTGRSAYFGVPELGEDALKAAHAVLTALWAHSDAVVARAEHQLVGRGFLLVTGIEGGGFIAVPERCTLSLIRKLLPGEVARRGGRRSWRRSVRGAVTDPEISASRSPIRPAATTGSAAPPTEIDRDARPRCGCSPRRWPGRCPGAAASRARPSGRRRRSSQPRSACRRSIARPATSATATPSRSTSSSTSISPASSPSPLHGALLRRRPN